MLPSPAGLAVELINRAGHYFKADLPVACQHVGRPGPEADRCRVAQRNTDDGFIDRDVAVPSQLRAGQVFGDEQMRNRPVLNLQPVGDAVSQRNQTCIKRRTGLDSMRVEIIKPAEAENADF